MHRRPLTRERIIAEAIQLADREGLSEVSLRRIASRLGVHVTSLYNHVPTKDAVVDGMVEYLMRKANLPKEVSDWKDWVRTLANGLRRVAHKHPGAIAAFHHRPVQGPEAAEFPELGLEAFRSAGCSLAKAYSAMKATALVVLGLLLEETKTPGRKIPETDVGALPPERFPLTHQLHTIAVPDIWAYTIETLVTGLDGNIRLMRAAKRTRRRARRRSQGKS